MKDLIRNILKEYVSLKSNISEGYEKKRGANIKPDITKSLKGSLWGDLSKGFSSDETIKGSYSAAGKSGVYDALHSFHRRRSDGFGGRINTIVQNGIKDYKFKNKNVKAVDIKDMYVFIDPNTLTVNWEVTIGPSTDGYTYEQFDSRGSAGGGESAVNGQLQSMHSGNSGEPKMVYYFNKTIPKCFNDNGTKKTGGCKGTINIQQKFFKYGNPVK
jgi:hypothetical protein